MTNRQGDVCLPAHDSYTYDIFGRLIGRELDANGDTVVDESGTFIYDGDQILLVPDETGNVDHRLLWGAAVVQILADENSSGDVNWMLTDHQNTVRDIVQYDEATYTTSVVNHLAYDAFGNVASETDPTLDVFNLQYTARYYDEATGLQYNNARWYYAATGQWISQDPIGFDAWDENLYRYVGNGPISRTDPSGLHWGEGGSASGSQDANAIEQWEMHNLATGRYQHSGIGQWIDSGTGLPVSGHPYFLEQAELERRALSQLSDAARRSRADIPSIGPYTPSKTERYNRRICELATGDGNIRKIQQIVDLKRGGYGLTEDEQKYYDRYRRQLPYAERQAFYEFNNYSYLGMTLDKLNPRWNGTGTFDDAMMVMAPFARVNPVTGERAYPGLIRPGGFSSNGGRFIFPDGQVDPAATVLGNKFGGQASVRIQGFGNREFDFISGRYVGQTFGGTTYSAKPKNFLSVSRREQIRQTIEAAKATGRQPLFNFEGGKPHQEVLDFISRNAERRCVTPKITNITPGPQ